MRRRTHARTVAQMRISDEAARELALLTPLEWSDADRGQLSPLVDAMLVWADDKTTARLAMPLVITFWQDGLRADIEEALKRAGSRDGDFAELVEAALSDLEAGPNDSRVALAMVERAAIELAGEEQGFDCCLLCVHDSLLTAPAQDRARLARTVARIATRAAAVPLDDVRRAVEAAALQGTDAALLLATDERRIAVHRWLGRLAELGERSIAPLAIELRALADESLPDAADDEVWREAVRGLAARVAPAWN